MRLRRGGETIVSASRLHQEPKTQGGDSMTPRGPKDPGVVIHQDVNAMMGTLGLHCWSQLGVDSYWYLLLLVGEV